MRAATLTLSLALLACVLALGLSAREAAHAPDPLEGVDHAPAKRACPCGPDCDCAPCACPQDGPRAEWWPGKFLTRPWRHPSRWRFPRRPACPRRCY